MRLVGRRSATVVGVLILLGLAFLLVNLLAINYLVDYWWFDTLGYAFYFIQRLLYRYMVFLFVTALFFCIFFFNFWIASRYLGTSATPSDDPQAPSKESSRNVLKMFRTGSMRVYTPLSLILGIVIAIPVFERWESFLLYIFGPQSGITDPVYGKDISFYLFSFPIYTLLQKRIFLSFVILLIGVLFLYWLEHRLLKAQDRGIHRGARIHVCCLLVAVFAIEIWDFFLQRYQLLYSSRYEPLFSGPGYAEMRVVLPFIDVCIILLAVIAVASMFFFMKRKGLKTLCVSIILFLLALAGRYSDVLPKWVNDYWVNPNAISRQAPYIRNNIDATLSAYNLNNVEIRNISPVLTPENINEKKIQGIFRNIPVWDGDLLHDVYSQLQELRTYYDFTHVDVSHYSVLGNNQQVFLSIREMNTDELPQGARNWVNDHLVYTHGYGAVMTPAAQGGDEPMTWFLKGIPLKSDFGFSVKQPGVYFGMLRNYPYVIVPNNAGEFGYPKGESNVTENYSGAYGVRINSAFRKLMFAYYLKDWNIFFTTKTNDKSRILFIRNIQDRVHKLTPYLPLDHDPYAVVTKNNLYWIQDAYTTSRYFPDAESYGKGPGSINYIRDSVKVVINAYDGKVDYYIFDPKDPIVNAYRRMYPGLFKDESQMPPALRSQVRYPQDIFDIQMAIYAKYHQTDPSVFYQQEDVWDVGVPAFASDKQKPNRSYYLTLDLIKPDRFDFLLISPVMPKGRDNLRALAIAGSDQDCYGKLIIYNFPKGQLVYGPAQIHSLINADPSIAQQLSLWDQAGSQVARGNMIIFPIGKMLIYIQPVYLKSSTDLKIPELKRLIMTQGQIVVMGKSLEDAFKAMADQIKTENVRIDKRFPQVVQEPHPIAPPLPPVPDATPASVPPVKPSN